MKKATGAMVLLAALSGCVSEEPGTSSGYMSQVWNQGAPGIQGNAYQAAAVPGFVGPGGAPVPVNGQYAVAPPGSAAARAIGNTNVPLDIFQQTLAHTPGNGSDIMQAQYGGGGQGFSLGGGIAPPGMVPMPAMAPPGLTPPGMMPPWMRPGVVAAAGALTPGMGAPQTLQRTEVRFVGPAGMKISWYAPTPDGKAGFTTQGLEAPGRYNFMQAAIYRLKLTDIPNRPGVELYPTLEVVPTNNKTSTFLAHSAVPVSFTEEDFQQVASGNYVVKVIYLPDPQFQDLASTGPDEVVSSRLEPGVDPIAEAHRRGSILLVVRLGNIDLEAPNTPAMDAPSPYTPKPLPPALPGMGGLPPMPGAPGMPPGQLPMLPMPLPPGGPVGKAAPNSDVQQASYKGDPKSSGYSWSWLVGDGK